MDDLRTAQGFIDGERACLLIFDETVNQEALAPERLADQRFQAVEALREFLFESIEADLDVAPEIVGAEEKVR